jgi:hypothetical protein
MDHLELLWERIATSPEPLAVQKEVKSRNTLYLEFCWAAA